MPRMKRILIYTLLVSCFIYLGNLVYHVLPVLSGYAAKVTCSCMFNSGRSQSDVQKNELEKEDAFFFS